jgi:Fe2+ transport system protein FeoA
MNLASLKNKERFRVIHVSAGGDIGKRLVEMGFSAGTEGHIVRTALLGDPIQVRIMHYDLSIRKAEASGIEVERIDVAGRHRHRYGGAP